MYSKRQNILTHSFLIVLIFSKIRNCEKLLNNSYLFYNLEKTQNGAYNEIAGYSVYKDNNTKEAFVELLYEKYEGLLLYNKIRISDMDSFVSKVIKINPENIDKIVDEEDRCYILINNHVEILNRNLMTYFWLAEVSHYYQTSINKIDKSINTTSPFLRDEHELIGIYLEKKSENFIEIKYGIILGRIQRYEYVMYLEKKITNNLNLLWASLDDQTSSTTSSTSTTTTTTTSSSTTSSSTTQSTTSSNNNTNNTNNGNGNSGNGRGHGHRSHRHYYSSTWFIVLISFIIIVFVAATMAGVYYVVSKQMSKETYNMVYNANDQF